MSETALVKKQPAELEFSPEQIKLIKSQIAVGATNDELKLFMYQAKRTGLDPLARQIYFIKRNVFDPKTKSYISKGAIQTSIDGFRVVAERSGEYAGQDEPEFEETDGYPTVCKVAVYKFAKDGQRYRAAVGVAYWNEYVQARDGKPTLMWAKMPHTMLSKVAEALALRKAFPQDLSGIYSSDEMEQAEDKTESKPEAQEEQPETLLPLEQQPKITTFQINKIIQLGKDLGNTEAQIIKKITQVYKIKLLGELNQDIAAQVIENMMKRKKERKMLSDDEAEEVAEEAAELINF